MIEEVSYRLPNPLDFVDIVLPLVEELVWELSVIARAEGRSPAVDALLAHLAPRLPPPA